MLQGSELPRSRCHYEQHGPSLVWCPPQLQLQSRFIVAVVLLIVRRFGSVAL